MSSQQRSTGAALGRRTQTPPRKVALIFGVLFLITFVVSAALRRIRVPVPPVPHFSLRDVAVLAALRAV
jgi:hypothetical protein